MSVDANAAGASPDHGDSVAQDLKNAEAFGIALAELEVSGVGKAHLELGIPDEKISGTVHLGRELAYTVEVKNGRLVINVTAG